MAARLAALTGRPFTARPNKFQPLAVPRGDVAASGALKTLAVRPHEDRQRHPLARLGPAEPGSAS